MKCKLLIFNLLLVSTLTFASNDTITVMQYNLMHYDNIFDNCDTNSNNVNRKNAYLATIVRYVQPDILTLNEVKAQRASVELILHKALNINGIDYYKRGELAQEKYTTNMVYYNSLKLRCCSFRYANSRPRKTQFYTFEVLNSLNTNDERPITLTCGLTHMKAGNQPDNLSQREEAARVIMQFIDNEEITGNVLFSGDFNMYDSQEPAFQILTLQTPSNCLTLHDPINRPGKWHNNSNFADLHTQSTRSEQAPCFSAGGFDDRFDFILTSENILNGTDGLQFVAYQTLGQDGKRFNQSLIEPINNSAPQHVIDALYNMSDHLPVIVKLIYNSTNDIQPLHDEAQTPKYNNPVTNELKLNCNSPIAKVLIYNILGQAVSTKTLSSPSKSLNINMIHYKCGMYFVRVINQNGTKQTLKVLKI